MRLSDSQNYNTHGTVLNSEREVESEFKSLIHRKGGSQKTQENFPFKEMGYIQGTNLYSHKKKKKKKKERKKKVNSKVK